jgi:hypothetical protein
MELMLEVLLRTRAYIQIFKTSNLLERVKSLEKLDFYLVIK